MGFRNLWRRGLCIGGWRSGQRFAFGPVGCGFEAGRGGRGGGTPHPHPSPSSNPRIIEIIESVVSVDSVLIFARERRDFWSGWSVVAGARETRRKPAQPADCTTEVAEPWRRGARVAKEFVKCQSFLQCTSGGPAADPPLLFGQ